MAALVAATVAGAATALNPTALAVACVAMCASIAISSPSARFAIVIAGGLVVFRSSDQLDAPKLAYLAWLGLCTAVAVAGLWAEPQRRRLADVRPLVVASAALVGALGLSLAVALSLRTPFVDWIRDAAPYCLLAVSPFLAWDGARSRLRLHMDVIAVVAGLMASVAFAVEWLGRRGLADLPFATLGSSSGTLSALAFVVAIGAILSGRPRRLLWALVAAAVITLLLVTGTRSALVLLVGPVAMLLPRGQRTVRARNLVGTVLGVVLAMVAMTLLVWQSGVVDVVRVTERLGSIFDLGSGLSADQSFIDRVTQARVAAAAFASSPLVGLGLGHTFESLRFGGSTVTAFTIDSSLSIAVKFGLIGLWMIAIGASAVMFFFWRRRLRIPEHLRLSFVGFAAISTAVLITGNPIEDKGFGLAMAILFAWALATARRDGVRMDTAVDVGAGDAPQRRGPERSHE